MKTDFATFIWEKLFIKNFSKFSLGNMCPFLCILLEFINWYCCRSIVNLSSVHFQCATLTWTCHPTCTHDMVTDHYNQLGRRPFASNCLCKSFFALRGHRRKPFSLCYVCCDVETTLLKCLPMWGSTLFVWQKALLSFTCLKCCYVLLYRTSIVWKNNEHCSLHIVSSVSMWASPT